MPETRYSCRGNGTGRETICVDTNRVTDSCRDKDCYEYCRVFVGAMGQELLDGAAATVRVNSAEILWCYLTIDPIRFNCGFYQINARFYVLVHAECCAGVGRAQPFTGIAVLDKKVILYGGEGNATVFRSDPDANRCNLPWDGSIRSTNTPTAACQKNLKN